MTHKPQITALENLAEQARQVADRLRCLDQYKGEYWTRLAKCEWEVLREEMMYLMDMPDEIATVRLEWVLVLPSGEVVVDDGRIAPPGTRKRFATSEELERLFPADGAPNGVFGSESSQHENPAIAACGTHSSPAGILNS